MFDGEKIVYSLDQIPDVAKKLIALMPQCAVFTFTGPLGAGKTSLVREMLRQLGIKGAVASPTFTYVNRYENDQGQTFYHFDLYRIEDKEDFIAAGFDEYLYQPNSWVFIEWPEPVMPLVDKKVCHVKIDYAGASPKKLKAKTGDKRELVFEIK